MLNINNQFISNLVNGLFRAIWSYLVGSFISFLLAVTDVLISLSNQMAVTIFDDSTINQFIIFIEIFGGMMFVVGVGFAIADWAINAQDGSGETIMTTFKNILIGLVASLGFTNIPILLLKFVNELCMSIVGNITLAGSLQPITNSINQLSNNNVDISAQQIIYPIYTIVMFVCVIKVFLSNVKCGGSLIVLMFVCPMHLFSIPRGYLDAFWSWCKQVVGLCLSIFIQNFLVALSLYFVINSSIITTMQLLSSIGLALAAFEAPKIMQQFGLDTSIKANATQAVYAANGISSLIKSFGK